MKYLVLFFALLCSAAAFAQQGTDTQIRYGTTNPSACLPHALFANTTSNPTVLYLCTATNTWVAIATASNITLTQVGPGTAGAGTYDFSGVTLLKMRFSAGLTTSTNGDFGVDTAGKNLHVYLNGADTIIPSVSGSWVNGNCGSIVFSGGQYAISDNGSPCGSGTTSAWSTITASANSHAGSFSATGNSWDWTGTVIFKLRAGPTLTTSANGDLAYDTTNKNWHAWQNAVDSFMFSGPVSATYTNGDCVKFGVAANVITLVDSSGACGGVQLAADLGNTSSNPQVISTHLASALPVNQGGTGQATLTIHGPVIGNGTGAVAAAAAGNIGQPFTSGGASANGAYSDTVDLSTVGVYGMGAGGVPDVAWSRDSAGVMDVGTGAQGSTAGTLQAAAIKTTGANGGNTYTEGTGGSLSPSTAVDVQWGDSTFQRMAMNNHNTGKVGVVGMAASGTPNDCTKIAANGWDIVDSLAGCGGISGLTAGYFPKAASSTSISNSLCDEGITTSNVLTCTDSGGASFGSSGGTGVVYTTSATNGIADLYGNGTGNTCFAASTEPTCLNPSGALTVYDAITTAASTGALGQPIQVGWDSQAAKTTAQTAKTLFATGSATTMYRANASIECTTTSAAATVLVSIIYTDTSSTVQTIASSTAACTALGSASNNSLNFSFRAKNGTNIQYSTTIVNTPTYDVSVSLEQLGTN